MLFQHLRRVVVQSAELLEVVFLVLYRVINLARLANQLAAFLFQTVLNIEVCNDFLVKRGQTKAQHALGYTFGELVVRIRRPTADVNLHFNNQHHVAWLPLLYVLCGRWHLTLNVGSHLLQHTRRSNGHPV